MIPPHESGDPYSIQALDWTAFTSFFTDTLLPTHKHSLPLKTINLLACLYYILDRESDLNVSSKLLSKNGLIGGQGCSTQIQMMDYVKPMRKNRHVWSIILLAMVWALWRSRNDSIFNNVRLSSLQILDAARVNVWLWIINILGMNYFAYSDWISKPFDCLNISL
ncbi:hypothetical protein Lal_00020408 [Lupinus albus]|nr:hypothetical protein Lal_00020408 [Lupinus albus]